MSNVIDRIGQLLSQLQSPDFYEREEAVRELGTYCEDEAVAGLVLALEDSDLGIRELAADRLGQMKGDIASQLLICYLGHEDVGTRNLAAEVLARMPFLEDRQDILKIAATKGLAQVGCKRALLALQKPRRERNQDIVEAARRAASDLERSLP